MPYIEESLSEGEQIVAIFKPHWFEWLPVAGWVLLGPLTFGITLFVAIYAWLQLKFLEQGVTNKRVIVKRGIIGRSTDEMKLASIETVEIEQGALGRMFGCGDVKVTGRGISDVVFRRIDDPMAVKRRIEGVSNPAT